VAALFRYKKADFSGFGDVNIGICGSGAAAHARTLPKSTRAGL
jgi:hypothetical protein